MSETTGLKLTVLSNLIWKFAERIGAQLVTFVVQTILARILMPEEYGIIAMVNVFITIANVFVVSGLSSSLIQKKNADELDFSSMFYFSIAFSLVIYGIVYFAAPYIGKFYNSTELILVLRIMALQIIIAAIKNVQGAYVSRHMQFKKFFFSTLGGTLFSGAIGIIMALKGAGVWALVVQYLSNSIIDTTILFFTVKWKPKLMFSLSRVKTLYSYGWKLLGASLLDTTYNQLRALIIGKLYSSADLAYYNRGRNFPMLITNNINASIDSVLFPAMSSQQDERAQLKGMVRRSIKTSSYILWPMLIGLAAVGDTLIRLLLTDKWVECVPFLQIACVSYMFMPIHTANLQAIKATGRSGLFFKMEIIKKGIGIILILISFRISVMAIALSSLVQTAIACIVNTLPNRKYLGYRYRDQFFDLLPAFLLSFSMGIIVYLMTYIPCMLIIKLFLQVVVGGIYYIAASRLFKVESFKYIFDIIEPKLKSILRKEK